MHPYAAQPTGVIDNVEATREVMNAHGDGGAPLWLTEFGWGTGGLPDSDLIVTPIEQADRIEEVTLTLSQRRARYGVQAAMVYTDHDFQDASSPCRWCPFAGLMTRDGRPKPAWLRFSVIARSTAAGPPPRLLATLDSTNRAVSIARHRRRRTGAQVITAVERYGDGSAIVEMNSDDVRLNKGSWRLTSCLRFLAGERPGSDDHSVCDKQKLKIKSRGKSFPPDDQLAPLTESELAGDPYASPPRVLGYVEAKKRVKGMWCTRLTSLGTRSAGIPLP